MVRRNDSRYWTSAVAVGVLLGSLLHAVPARAEATPAVPAPPTGPAVRGVTKAPTRFKPPKDESTPYRPAATAWPAGASADVSVGGAQKSARAANSR